MSMLERLKNILAFRDTDSGMGGMWVTLDNTDEVDAVFEASKERVQVVFKHSVRCSVSLFAKLNIESFSLWEGKEADRFIIDVVRKRTVSDYFAEKSGIKHESPQIFILKDGEVIWSDAHSYVNKANIKRVFAQLDAG